MEKDSRILEIGAGTGKVTVQFARRGFRIHAIEMGEEMARILWEKCAPYPHVSMDIVPFEEWDVSGEAPYDLVYSAQAFHLLDAVTKYQKCHELLKEGGWLALFWYQPSDEDIPETKRIEEKISEILARYAAPCSPKEKISEKYTYKGDPLHDEKQKEIETSGLFEFRKKITYTHEIRNRKSPQHVRDGARPQVQPGLHRMENAKNPMKPVSNSQLIPI